MRRFSLVRGRDLWRLVGAEEITDAIPIDPRTSSESLAVYARVLSLIRRLVRGQEKNDQVFLTLFSLYKLLGSAISAEIARIDLSALETLAVFRIPHSLGYIKFDATTELLILPEEIDRALIVSAKPLVPSLISAINAGLTESHL